MDRPFPIVGVGASAGGVEALEYLFKAMPPEPGMAFVVVTHLAPKRESMLPEILARDTRMPVLIAEHDQEIRPNHVYVVPADKVLDISKGRLGVRAMAETHERTPIDSFFAALAEDQGEYAIGIVLSGAGSDGTLGIKAIKEHGGLTLAQATDHSGPRHSSMPESAIASGLVDLAVPVESMPAQLAAYVRSFDILDKAVDNDAQAETSRRAICAILLDQAGHDFSGYKTRTFYRRIERRMQVLQIDSLAAYTERLRQDPGEVNTLFRDLLIGVTNFFRDAKAFEALEELVMPRLFEGKSPADTIRVWVPGCATGEEVYSLAILLREQAEKSRSRAKIQIFATDIDEAALSVARSGRYPDTLLQGVSKQRLGRFFSSEGTSYVINKPIRDMCVFSSHSVVRDPPFSRMDLISCRNLLIYLNSELQGHVIPIFHYALKPHGFLFLGTSENITQHGDLFTSVDKKNRMFQRREDGAAMPQLPVLFRRHGVGGGVPAESKGPAGPSLRQSVEARVLERYAPAHVVVTREGDVINYSAGTGKYLEAPAGRPSRALMAMARKGLRLPLRSALHEAIEARRPAVRDNVELETGDKSEFVRITIEPMRDDDNESLYLVVFSDVRAPQPEERPAKARKSKVRDGTLAQLERELRETRERLQSMSEEYETAIEELKSSNEEMVSVNEELQSTNEELETSKEELQSVNEELQTVNHELTVKIDELDHANSDLKNLYESTDIATIFLDRELIIRSFTPAVTRIFNLIPGDRGRPLTDIAHHLDYAELAQDIQQVFGARQPLERRVGRRDGAAHYIVRALPYWTGSGKVEGAVLTFSDVTGLAQGEERQRVLVSELNHRVKDMLTLIDSMATETLRSDEPGREAFLDRLKAMMRSYELVSRDQWSEVSLHDVMHQVIEPYRTGRMDRVVIEGPDVALKPKLALSLGMILHELGTNSEKHGSLSTARGSLEVSWAVEKRSQTSLVLDWIERGGLPVGKPPRNGFGLTLVEREVTEGLAGKANIEFQDGGLRATLRIPLEAG
ncbi:MAG TPA: CheR family methyltransferase [Xanthobacteraceae bacterium]|nr:CheR family methyltransferase [Xanthobacteraceae bacterium]